MALSGSTSTSSSATLHGRLARLRDLAAAGVGREPLRASIEVVVESASGLRGLLPLPADATGVSVVWCRSSTVTVTGAAPVTGPFGAAVFRELMRHQTTLFRTSPGRLLPKEYTFKLQAQQQQQQRQASAAAGSGVPKGRTLARAHVDLAAFCSADLDREPRTTEVAVPLAPHGMLHLRITTTWLHQQPAGKTQHGKGGAAAADAAAADAAASSGSSWALTRQPGATARALWSQQFVGGANSSTTSSSSTRPRHSRRASICTADVPPPILETDCEGNCEDPVPWSWPPRPAPPPSSSSSSAAAAAAAARPGASCSSLQSKRSAEQLDSWQEHQGAADLDLDGVAECSAFSPSKLARQVVAAPGSSSAGHTTTNSSSSSSSSNSTAAVPESLRSLSGRMPAWLWPSSRLVVGALTSDQLMRAINSSSNGGDVQQLQHLARGLLCERNDWRARALQAERAERTLQQQLSELRAHDEDRALLVQQLVDAKLALAQADLTAQGLRGLLNKHHLGIAAGAS